MPPTPGTRAEAFRHEALVYSGAAELVDRLVPFVRGGLERDEPVMVMLDPRKLAALRRTLGADRSRVEFADMEELGANPAHIIPAWREFVSERSAPGRRLRGVGEPVWEGRTAAALAETEHHDTLLNLACADADDLWLLCPYDAGVLAPGTVAAAYHSHPFVIGRDGGAGRGYYDARSASEQVLESPLPEPPFASPWIAFDAGSIQRLRAAVSATAIACGLPADREAEFVLAVDEIASNSIRHGGGRGRARLWEQSGTLVCEVRDRGVIEDPLIGRVRPEPLRRGGRGVWIANRCCDLVQVRSSADEGTTVRLHTRIAGR